MNYTFDFLISSDVDTVQTAFFEVPIACDAIKIEHNLEIPLSLLVVMEIVDSQGRVRLQKQLGYSDKLIGIGKKNKDTTIGGIPGIIENGNWSIKIFLFTEYVQKYIKDEQINFSVNIFESNEEIKEHLGEDVWVDKDFEYSKYDNNKIINMRKKWYKGDFHAHTRLSDGKELPEGVLEKAYLMHLDFYTATEHNLLHTGWPKSNLLVLPGTEITTTVGHANLFGISKRPDFMESVLQERDKSVIKALMIVVAKECKLKNWLFSINHPFLSTWKWEIDELPLEYLTCLEIINDPTYECVEGEFAAEANQLAVKLSDLLWEDGYRICAIGGSDSHNLLDERYQNAKEPSIAGDPATWLFMDGLSADNCYTALKSCKSCVTRHIEMFELEIKAGDNKIAAGEIIDNCVNTIIWNIELQSKRKKPELFVLINGVRTSLELRNEDMNTYKGHGCIDLPRDEYVCIRFGAETKDNEFMLYVNPITRGKKEHNFITFGDARKAIDI